MAVVVDPVLLDLHDARDEAGRRWSWIDSCRMGCRRKAWLWTDSSTGDYSEQQASSKSARAGPSAEESMSLSDHRRGRTQRGRHRRRARHPEAALRRALPDRPGDPRPARATPPPISRRRRRTASCSPRATEEVQEVVRVCAEHRVPVIAFGIGTSLEGHVNAPGGGISLDTSRMNRDPRGQSGRSRLHRRARRHARGAQPHLRDTGLFFPIDPGANATPRRHGGDAGVGHQCGALRHDARQRAVADGGDGRRAA